MGCLRLAIFALCIAVALGDAALTIGWASLLLPALESPPPGGLLQNGGGIGIALFVGQALSALAHLSAAVSIWLPWSWTRIWGVGVCAVGGLAHLALGVVLVLLTIPLMLADLALVGLFVTEVVWSMSARRDDP